MIIDDFINANINGYVIEKHLGGGAIGQVFYGFNESFKSKRAIKFIPFDKLKLGWENEITKVNELNEHENVVHYYEHGDTTIKDIKYLYIMWQYIESDSLKTLIANNKMTIEMLINVVDCILTVLHSCSVVNVVHADLHSGNILIQKENKLSIDPTIRKIWVTDFGYLTQDDNIEYLDDYVGLDRLIQECLHSIDFNIQNGDNKKVFRYFKNVFSKYILEANPVVGEYVRNAKELRNMLLEYINGITN